MADRLICDSVTGCDGSQLVTRPFPQGLTCDNLGVNAKPCGALPDVTQPAGIDHQIPEKAPQSFDFGAIPEVGALVMLHGQRYEMIGAEPYVRRSGQDDTMTLWATHCARCGGPFIARVLLPTAHGTRRCEPCRTIERGRV